MGTAVREQEDPTISASRSKFTNVQLAAATKDRLDAVRDRLKGGAKSYDQLVNSLINRVERKGTDESDERIVELQERVEQLEATLQERVEQLEATLALYLTDPEDGRLFRADAVKRGVEGTAGEPKTREDWKGDDVPDGTYPGVYVAAPSGKRMTEEGDMLPVAVVEMVKQEEQEELAVEARLAKKRKA